MSPELAQKRALVVGAGAIGGPVILALASAGVGRLRFCDTDTVEVSNLQRQIQFTAADVGASKVETLAARLLARGVESARIEARSERFAAETAGALLDDADIVVDGSDNFATKFAVSDEAAKRRITAIVASAVGTSGQIFVSRRAGPCYRCLFEAPPQDDPGNCAQVGILAPLPGVVAGHAAAVALDELRGLSQTPPLAVVECTTPTPRWIDFDLRADCPSHGAVRNTSSTQTDTEA